MKFQQQALVALVSILSVCQPASAEEDELTCYYDSTENVYYCATGDFDDLVSDCLIISDPLSCCIVTDGEAGCPDAVSKDVSVIDLLKRVLEDGHAVTFSAPSEEAKRKFSKKE